MDIVVNEELKAYIGPLTAEEYEALEHGILAEGCRDALVPRRARGRPIRPLRQMTRASTGRRRSRWTPAKP